MVRKYKQDPNHVARSSNFNSSRNLRQLSFFLVYVQKTMYRANVYVPSQPASRWGE